MSWLTKIFGRDDSERRLADAHLEVIDARRELDATRELTGRLRHHSEQNNFTKRMAAAFAADERRRHA